MVFVWRQDVGSGVEFRHALIEAQPLELENSLALGGELIGSDEVSFRRIGNGVVLSAARNVEPFAMLPDFPNGSEGNVIGAALKVNVVEHDLTERRRLVFVWPSLVYGMTCIVGLEEKGKVWLGADSAGVAGYSLTVRADEKVFTDGPFVFGFTSSFRMGQLLRYSFVPPDHDPRVEIDRYMATTFIDAVRNCLKAGGVARNDMGVETAGQFLVGYQGNLFFVDYDFQVGRSTETFNAVGCGQDLALGAMFASEGLKPQKRIEQALSAAAAFSAGVRGPFKVLSV